MPHFKTMAILVILTVLAIGGCVGFELHVSKSDIPPESVKTLQDLKAWLGDNYRGIGEYQNGDTSYKVVLGASSMLMPSGPAAYVVDENIVIDYSLDMGDIPTRIFHWDLSSGNVKNIVCP